MTGFRTLNWETSVCVEVQGALPPPPGEAGFSQAQPGDRLVEAGVWDVTGRGGYREEADNPRRSLLIWLSLSYPSIQVSLTVTSSDKSSLSS